MSQRWLVILSNLALVAFFSAACATGTNEDFDILIENGRVVDGTGNPWFYADVGITGNSIVAVGDLANKTARKTIDANGLVVSPGFIDVHAHSERGFGESDSNANLNYLVQGVTTVVTGNDGGGTFKVAETKGKWEASGIGTNAVHLVGFGAVREEVMGAEPREPTTEELEKMRSLVRQAMEEGAWGMSSGLEYIPGRYATTEEIIAVAKVVGEFGGVYSSHQRNEFDGVLEATQETIRIADPWFLCLRPRGRSAGQFNSSQSSSKELLGCDGRGRSTHQRCSGPRGRGRSRHVSVSLRIGRAHHPNYQKCWLGPFPSPARHGAVCRAQTTIAGRGLAGFRETDVERPLRR